MTMRKWASASALMAVIAPNAALARPELRLDTQMFVERVRTDINGRARRTLAAPRRVEPGDRLIYVVNWRHEGSAPLNGLAVTRAVPSGMRLALSDPATQVSVDGGQSWGRLDQLWLPTPLGGSRRAVLADVTHVRWTIPASISPGETGRLSYRVTAR